MEFRINWDHAVSSSDIMSSIFLLNFVFLPILSMRVDCRDPVNVRVAVLRLNNVAGQDGLPDRWFGPAIKAAGDAFAAANPNTVTFDFREDYPLSVPCTRASSTPVSSRMFMKSFMYATGTTTVPAVDVMLGPHCSFKILPSATAAAANGIAQITGGGDTLRDITNYPGLYRTGYSKVYQFDILLKYLAPKYGWKNLAVLYEVDNPQLHWFDFDS
jgi:hypothetical protein